MEQKKMSIDPSFVEVYRIYEPSPSETTLEKRWAVLQSITKKKSRDDVLSFCDLATNRNSWGFSETLGNLFFANDATFKLTDNSLELAVLSTAALDIILSTRTTTADLAATSIVAALGGPGRQFEPWHAIVHRAKTYLRKEANYVRKLSKPDGKPAKFVEASKKLAEHKTRLEANEAYADQAELTDILSNLQDETAKHLTDIIDAAAVQFDNIKILDEELNVLSWCFSQYSRDLEQSLAELTTPEAVFVAAKELADLTRIFPGVVAPSGILNRVLHSSGHKLDSQHNLAEIASKVPENIDVSMLMDASEEEQSLCSNLYSVACKKDIGEHWHEKYNSVTGCNHKTKEKASQIASEMYHEWMLLHQL